MPLSSDCMTLLRPVGTILPGAVATISTQPSTAQVNASTKNRMIVPAMARPAGEAGVSMISSAAGRNSRSSRDLEGNGSLRDAATMSPHLQQSDLRAVEQGVPAAAAHKFVMRAVFDDPAVLDRDYAVGLSQGREAMGDDEDGPPDADPAHVLLDHPFAFVVEGARRLIKDQYPWIGDKIKCASESVRL